MATSPTNPSTTDATGGAPVVKTGHTAQDNYGSNPQMAGKGQSGVRDLSIQTKSA